MDEKQGLMPTDQKSLLDLDQTYKAITSTEAVKGHGLNVRRAHSEGTIVTRSEDSETDTSILLMRKPSSGKGMTTSRANVIKPAMTSAQFCIDSNQLVTGGTRSLTEVKRTRANSCGLEFSLPLVGATLSEDVSSVTNHHHLSDLSISEKRDFSSARWKKMQIELTMPIHLKFSDVRYKVKCKMSSDNMKYVLHGVTGSVDPGEVLALMGPSGGGKTTLINLLSGRMKIKDQDCSITYNDQPYSKWLKRRIGFVLQDDAVLPYLTVRETLTYTALLRLPKALTKQKKEEKAMDVITELGLESCQDTIIVGISGGERKRVCIGNEILLDPSLLFLDEPTSGLDSTTALRIAQMLHGIAKVGKTVVTTIHQPSSRLFNKFDKLILLGKGNSLYFGKASEAIVYFSSIGYSPLIAMNPAEFLIDLANGNINDISIPSELEDRTTDETHEEIQHPEGQPSSVEIHEYLVDAYESKVAYIQKKRIQKPVQIDCKWNMQESPNSIDVGASWWEQYNILFWRGLKGRRHDYLSYVRVTQVISTAIIIGLLWWHSDTSSPKKLHGQAGLLFFISIFWGFLPVFTSIFTFPQERVMLAKERSVDMYKSSAYFIARNMSDLPLDLILHVVFLLIVYFMVGLRAVFTVFMKTMMTAFLCIVAAQGLGLVIGAAVMDVKKAATLASVIIMTFMLAGGFFIERVPFFVSWVRYLSFNYHTYRLLLKIQYCCSITDQTEFTPCKSSFIKGLQLDDGGMEVSAMIAMVFGYRLLAYIFLKKMKLQIKD